MERSHGDIPGVKSLGANRQRKVRTVTKIDVEGFKLGITGTRRGMSKSQRDKVTEILSQRPIEAHSGDCIGVDEQFHGIAAGLWIKTVGHPPKNEVYRAFCKFTESYEEKSYLERNRFLVNSVDVMICCPKEDHPPFLGGTGYTYWYARSLRKPQILIHKDGLTILYNLSELGS